MTAGLKQGDPLSAGLFVFLFDVVVRTLDSMMSAPRGVRGIVAATADDIAIVVANVFAAGGILADLFQLWGKGTGQNRNPEKGSPDSSGAARGK